MRTDQCISVTDLRRKTGSFIGKDSYTERFVFVGSKPVNVLLTMKRYEELRRIEDALYEQSLDLQFSPYDTLSIEERSEYDTAIKRGNNSFINF